MNQSQKRVEEMSKCSIAKADNVRIEDRPRHPGFGRCLLAGGGAGGFGQGLGQLVGAGGGYSPCALPFCCFLGVEF
jgi:hypothetical protein